MRKIRDMEVATTASELRDRLLVMFEELEHGQIKESLAKEKNNTAGKIVKSAALQIDFASTNKIKAKCKFVEDAE